MEGYRGARAMRLSEPVVATIHTVPPADLSMLEGMNRAYAQLLKEKGEEAANQMLFEQSRQMSLSFRAIETSGKPWVAAIKRRFGTEVSTSSLPRSSCASNSPRRWSTTWWTVCASSSPRRATWSG